MNNPVIMHKLMTSKLVDPPVPDTDCPGPDGLHRILVRQAVAHNPASPWPQPHSFTKPLASSQHAVGAMFCGSEKRLMVVQEALKLSPKQQASLLHARRRHLTEVGHLLEERRRLQGVLKVMASAVQQQLRRT